MKDSVTSLIQGSRSILERVKGYKHQSRTSRGAQASFSLVILVMLLISI